MSDFAFSYRALSTIRNSDRKPTQKLGVTATRDSSECVTRRLPFRFWRSIHRDNHRHRPGPALRPTSFVWDVPNPFLSDPSQADSAHTERLRRFDSIGPLDPLPDVDDLDDLSDFSFDEYLDGNEYLDDDSDEFSDHTDADDELEDTDDEDDSSFTQPSNTIDPPKLLHTAPLVFIPPTLPLSSSSHPMHFYPTSSELGLDSGDDDLDPFKQDAPALEWPACLAQTYNDLAEAEERAARQAKRDALRSRMKVLAILGPEASAAF